MSDWTDDEEFSGRKAFDEWRFIKTERPVAWDWADMATGEKRLWIERAQGSLRAS